MEKIENSCSIASEAPAGETADILEEKRLRLHSLEQMYGEEEQVPFVRGPELLAGDRERRARDAAREQVGPVVLSGVEHRVIRDVTFDNVPGRTVRSKGVAGVGIDLDSGEVLEPRLLEAERLTTCAGADLND
jgi:hypothetical protein